jgi:hypothetical protein
MSDATMRSRNNLAIWLGVAIAILPLVPYALRGTGA